MDDDFIKYSSSKFSSTSENTWLEEYFEANVLIGTENFYWVGLGLSRSEGSILIFFIL